MEATPGNVAPRILSRPEHNLSRKNIDPDALKVLYRLKNNGFVAYLVGGGVRDLLLERQPKDFDIGTSAHPQQVRKLFRNCFIVGRRFRLAHVRFGRKVVEVSTFRKAAEPEERRHAHPPRQHLRHPRGGRLPPRLHRERALLRHRQLLGHRLGGRARGPDRPRHPHDRRPRGALPRGPGAHAARGGARRAARLHDRPATPRRPCAPCAARSCAAAPPASSRSSTRSCARAARGAPSRCCTSTGCSPTSSPRRTTRSPAGRRGAPRLAGAPRRAPAGRASPPPTSSRTRS